MNYSDMKDFNYQDSKNENPYGPPVHIRPQAPFPDY